MSKTYPAAPAMSIDSSKTYSATIDTSKGRIELNLFAREAPATVNNFVFLARDKFYDNTVFHRVIANFMIQGGDPEGTGRGGPGYTIKDELKGNPHKHTLGALSMAKTAAPNSGGSQFFITHTVTDHLDGVHTVFGKVKDDASQKVVNAIRQGDKINSITISES